MPYGYLGQNTPNQTKSNSGVFSISDVADLEKQGKFGGSLELIEEQTVSGVSYIDFTSIKENIYDVHFLQVSVEDTDTGTPQRGARLRFYESGVLETASVYQYAHQYGSAGGSFGEIKSTADSSLEISGGDNDPLNSNDYIYLYNLGNSSKYSFTSNHSTISWTTTLGYYFMFGGGVLPQASTVNGIRYFLEATDTFSGTAKLYGVKQL